MKKKSFGGMFVKRWLIALAVAVVLCVPLTHLICKGIIEDTAAEKIVVSRAIMNKYDWVRLVCENDGSDPELNAKKYKALSHMCGARPGSVIIDTEDNVIVPNEDVAILSTTASPGVPLICDLSYFSEIDYEGRLELYTNDMYIKDGHFLPGESDILYNASIRGEKNIGTVDLTPENTEGYMHITDKSGLISFSVIRSKEHVEALDKVWYHHKFSYGGETTYVLATKGFMKYVFYEQVSKQYDGHTFTLLSSIEVDIWEIGKAKFITTYVIMVTLSAFAGVIWALISHKNYEKLRYQQILTNSLAHDLKSPITVVSGYVENIEQNICPEKKDAYISSIGQNVGRMNDIISNIIELSKLETNKKKMEKTPCCGAAIINKVLAEYEELIKEKELTVEVSGDGIFMWNEMAITRAFDNLINNAVTHSPKKGVITINISQKCIEISNSYNNQITVKPEQLFDPFVKGDASRGSNGTGLGLCIAKGIFDMHKLDASIELGEMFKVKIEKVNLIKKYRMLIVVAASVILLGAIAGGIYSCWYNSNHITYVSVGSGTESDSEEETTEETEKQN